MKSPARIALKEWAVVVRALRDGRQDVLLRKGGIADDGGVFRLQESEFFLYPTFEHQKADLLNAAARPELEKSLADRPAGKVLIDTWAEVKDVRLVKSPDELKDLPERTVWSRAYIDQRLGYKPEKPLYLVTLACRRLARPHLIDEDPSYAGCVSWVPLKDNLEVTL